MLDTYKYINFLLNWMKKKEEKKERAMRSRVHGYNTVAQCEENGMNLTGIEKKLHGKGSVAVKRIKKK